MRDTLHIWKHKVNGGLVINTYGSNVFYITSSVHDGVEISFRMAGKTKTLRGAVRFCKEFMSSDAAQWDQVK